MDWKTWQKRVGLVAAVITAIGAVIGVWFGFVSMIDRRFAELHDDNTALRDDVREDIGKVETALHTEIGKVNGNVDALRTDVTKIVADVGYLRGRMDERDEQQTVD